MHESHSHEQWDDGKQYDSIFAEDLLGPDISSTEPEKDDGDGVGSTPPAHKKRRFVFMKSSQIRSFSQEASSQVHRG